MTGLQVLCSVAGADERTAPNLTTPQLQWLAETNFMSGLVEQLQSESNSDAGSNARTVLVGVARSPLSAPLLQPLLDPGFFQPLLDSAFAAPVSVQVSLAAPWSLFRDSPAPLSSSTAFLCPQGVIAGRWMPVLSIKCRDTVSNAGTHLWPCNAAFPGM